MNIRYTSWAFVVLFIFLLGTTSKPAERHVISAAMPCSVITAR